MDTESVVVICASVAAAITGSMGWIKWWAEHREKNRERAGKEKLKEEMEFINNRADAAFFSPSAEAFNMLNASNDSAWHVTNGNVLCSFRNQVPENMPTGKEVVLPLANYGESPRSVAFRMNGERVRHVRFINGSPGLWGFLEYPFSPERFGKREIIEVTFESASGAHRTHRYLTEHGKKVFLRIDPPLPS